MQDKQVHADRGSVGIKGDNNHVDQRELRALLLLQMVYAAADPSPPPYANSPHLGNCRHCGRRWVSTLALFCPLCGYSAQADRIAMRRRIDARDMLCVGAGFSLLHPLIITLLALFGATVEKSTWMSAGSFLFLSMVCLALALVLQQRIKQDTRGPEAPDKAHHDEGEEG